MICHVKGYVSILGPADKLQQDENKTKRAHSCVILVSTIEAQFYLLAVAKLQ